MKISESPWVYVFAISLHFWIGNILSSIIYSKRFGKSPNLLTKQEHGGNHKRITMRISFTVFLWALVFIREAFFVNIFNNFITQNLLEISPILGWIIYFIGLLGMVSAQYNMGSSFRIGQSESGDHSDLKVDGFWKYSRNPIYVFSYLALVGATFWMFSLAGIITILVLGFLFDQLIKVEEVYLEKNFGEEYILYKSRTSRYLGYRLK